MAPTISTARLVLRSWHIDDAAAALQIYGQQDVARWLSPAMDRVADVESMRELLQHWIDEDSTAVPPSGRWALLPLPPGDDDLEIGWQLRPDVWGQGFATEATHGVAGWAFTQEIDEVFAVVRPGNARAAATARRNGMSWVGETDKYYGLTLQVYRLRPADLRATQLEKTTGTATG
jgi:RimJ/RimL family protein N-acetyltransferase